MEYEKPSPIEAFQAVVSIVGSQAAIAKTLNKRASTVTYWSRNGIPAEDAVALERATGGRVPRWVARPDLWEEPNTEAAQ